MSQRLTCLLHECHRTNRNDKGFEEWICQKHWGAVPKKYRKLYSMAKRKFKRGEIDDNRIQSIWNKCKDQAFVRAWSV